MVYISAVNSGLSESTKDTRLNDQYGGLCLTAKLRIPFKVLAKEGKESAVVKQQQTIEEFLLRQQQILKSREDGIPIREDDAKATVKPVNFPQPSEVDAITEYQNIHPLSHSSESDKLKYISHKENGKFTNIAKESKVAKYLSDRVKLYLDVKSAITHDPHLAAKTRVIFQKVEKYFRGILNFNENEIRDIIDMFGLHNESDYDIGYEELTRDHTTASPTVIIVVLFCIFALLTVLTIILIMKHLR
uniref:Uncharacterized protein n=1 Tax=Rhabditophanes sp. KR3021 TaxID=114890 RepID=A0AC35U3Q8_9BILA